MKEKYYAVAVGRKPGIYRTWEDCQKQTDGFSKARFKRFKTEKEAREFIKEIDKQRKADLNARNDKAKYTDDEIARAKWLESQAKFLVRDRISNENIDTRNKWIGITNLKKNDKWNSEGLYAPEILSFDAEIFERTEEPVYDEDMTDDEKHQLTYDVAEHDIEKQQRQENQKGTKVNRPKFHVDVATKHNKGQETEYQIQNIRKK